MAASSWRHCAAKATLSGGLKVAVGLLLNRDRQYSACG
jgi:hypothetical protein